MNLFNIGNIIGKFNKLQEAQRKEVARLVDKTNQAKSDQAKGEAISKALKAITGE